METRRQGRKVKGTPGSIYKVERISGMHGNRGGQKMDMQSCRCLDFQELVKREDILRFGPCVMLMIGDVTAGYHNPRR